MDDSQHRGSGCRSDNCLQPLAHTKSAQRRDARRNSYACLSPGDASNNSLVSSRTLPPFRIPLDYGLLPRLAPHFPVTQSVEPDRLLTERTRADDNTTSLSSG